jgi:hypothetical protein
MTPEEQYCVLYHAVKLRLIDSRQILEGLHSVFGFEKAALQVRKVTETITYSALIASASAGKAVPKKFHRDAKRILAWLQKNNVDALPALARRTAPTEGAGERIWEICSSLTTVGDVRRLARILRETDRFLHGYNPYLGFDLKEPRLAEFISAGFAGLQRDHQWLWNRFWCHTASIDGEFVFVSLGSSDDAGRPEVVGMANALSKLGAHGETIESEVWVDWTSHPVFEAGTPSRKG